MVVLSYLMCGFITPASDSNWQEIKEFLERPEAAKEIVVISIEEISDAKLQVAFGLLSAASACSLMARFVDVSHPLRVCAPMDVCHAHARPAGSIHPSPLRSAPAGEPKGGAQKAHS